MADLPNPPEFYLAILEVMREQGGPIHNKDLWPRVLKRLDLSPEQLAIPSSKPDKPQAVNYANWGRSKLTGIGYVERVAPLVYQLTEQGKADTSPDPSEIERLYRARTKSRAAEDAAAIDENLTDLSRHLRNPALEQIRRHLEVQPCVILQGPPGTGKTFMAEALIALMAGSESRGDYRLSHLLDAHSSDGTVRALLEENGDLVRDLPIVWDIIQAHPGYAYEDFVRGLTTDDSENAGGLRFVPRDGIFVQMSQVGQARSENGGPVLLVVDEINRCNLASVLGELILVLESSKRGYEDAEEDEERGFPVRLQYAGDPKNGTSWSLTVPPNLWLLGTMNTADRSIALVDYAIRRRFRFVDMPPDPGVLEKLYGSSSKRYLRTRHLMQTINDVVADPKLKVGHSYFIVDPASEPEEWARLVADKMLYEVVPLLREYYAENRLAGPARDGSKLELCAGCEVDLEKAEEFGPQARLLDALVVWLMADDVG